MCGIAGIINYQDSDLQRFVKSLQHRGPDDQTIYKDGQVALLHTRLAIQDIQHGVQPLHYEHYSIIFNGEIYNHLALRQHLPEFNFTTNSDTETLLYLFMKYQFRMFEMLDGMYAFCIHDRAKHQLILARDRAGKKPLYYFQDTRHFVFASELNAIKSIKKLTPCTDAINAYLRTGFIWHSNTAYQKVYELPAASYMIVDTNTLNQQTYSHFNILDYYQQVDNSLNLSNCLDQTETHLQRSIADRITASDVEVGVFLSGGIDSNLIAAMASQIKPNIKTFTIKFDGLYDESSLAKLTADKYHTQHIELNITSHITHDIEKILFQYGEPFMDSSAIPSYYVSREASKHVKVVLGGDGADELFAGYRRYVPAKHGILYYLKFFKHFLKILPDPQKKQSIYNYLHRLIILSGKKNLDFYLSSTTDIFEDMFSFKHNHVTTNLCEFIKSVLENRKLSPLKKMLYLDHSILLFSDLLVKMDIASMANSLEVRSPFLSKYMLEFAPNIPDHFKINGLKTKFILRKLAEKYLPTELINQPKRGFEVPLKKWIDIDLRENIHDLLIPGCYAENYINGNFIRNLLANKLAVSPEKRAKMIWSLYCLEVWHKHE